MIGIGILFHEINVKIADILLSNNIARLLMQFRLSREKLSKQF